MIRNAPSTVSMPDAQREQRGDEPAEHEQREQEQQREGEQLGPREVLGDLRADLRRGDRQPAERDLRPERALEPLRHHLVVGAGARPRQQVRRPTVTRAVAGHDAGDPGVGAQHRLGIGGRPAHQRDHGRASADAPVARWTSRLGLQRLGVRVVEVATRRCPADPRPVRRARRPGRRTRRHPARTRRRRVSVKRARASNTTPWIVSDYLLFCQARSPGSLTPSSIHV